MASVGNVGTTSNNVFSNASTGNSAQKQQIDFLSMLMVQLKNQNPSQPYDNQQFAAQLATFSQLEQLTDIKTLLTDQADVIGMMAMSMENTALPGMIGKYATAMSDVINTDGTNPSEIGYDVKMAGTNGTAYIKDSSGTIVRKIEMDASQIRVGEHNIKWDGCDDAGNKLPPGNYKISIDITETDGNVSNPETYTVGKIEAVRFKNTGTVVVINGNEVMLSAINDVRENPYS